MGVVTIDQLQGDAGIVVDLVLVIEQAGIEYRRGIGQQFYDDPILKLEYRFYLEGPGLCIGQRNDLRNIRLYDRHEADSCVGGRIRALSYAVNEDAYFRKIPAQALQERQVYLWDRVGKLIGCKRPAQ